MSTPKSSETPVCQRCPTHQTSKVKGMYYKSLWFCSRGCQEAFEEDELDMLADMDDEGRDAKGCKDEG